MSKELILTRFGQALIKASKQKGLSLRKLATGSGLEYAHVQRISKGKVNLELTTLIALCDGLEMTPEELFYFY